MYLIDAHTDHEDSTYILRGVSKYYDGAHTGLDTGRPPIPRRTPVGQPGGDLPTRRFPIRAGEPWLKFSTESDRKRHNHDASDQIPDVATCADEAAIAYQADIDDTIQASDRGQSLWAPAVGKGVHGPLQATVTNTLVSTKNSRCCVSSVAERLACSLSAEHEKHPNATERQMAVVHVLEERHGLTSVCSEFGSRPDHDAKCPRRDVRARHTGSIQAIRWVVRFAIGNPQH
ncbi:hypothetical protein K438DRAFT_1767733 [Mycena galopus ATCC 62051]|nr:hypothetical protein K438DRAFT_1767733 [Mycena galopus ATCC 62051]